MITQPILTVRYGFYNLRRFVELSRNGDVPEWSKGADCKSAIRGFESHRRLLFFESSCVVTQIRRRLIDDQLKFLMGGNFEFRTDSVSTVLILAR